MQIPDVLLAWRYTAFLALLVTPGVGGPLPKDVLLLVGGYLISAGVFSWYVALPTAVAGVIVSDLLLHQVGYWTSTRSHRLPLLGRWLPFDRVRQSAEAFTRGADRLILLARLVPGTRVAAFLAAGFAGVKPARFIAVDAVGTIIWVPLLFAAGIWLEQVAEATHLVAMLQQSAILFVIVAMSLVFVARRALRLRHASAKS